MVGQNVGNYRITRLLAEGGMGAVYLAEHPGLGRRAAVKVLDTALARDNTMIDRFFNEAKAANAIGHPGIVEIWDFGVLPGGTAYIVMEYLAGESLADRLKRARRLSLRDAVEIVDQVASALGAAHAQGIVHRDLKPDNVFIVSEARVKILDFGIAKLAQRPGYFDDVRTRTGALLGTPQYMSPEQCRDASDVDLRTDVYSLGIVLYEMLVGRPPFASVSWGELCHQHLGTMPPAPRTLAPELPEAVEQVILKALEKDPGARFQSMTALQDALQRASVRTLIMPELAAPDPAPRVGGTLRFDRATLPLPPSATDAEPGAATATIAETPIEITTPTVYGPTTGTATETTMTGAAVALDGRSRAGARRPRWVAPVFAAGALGGVFLVAVAIWGRGEGHRVVERHRTLEAPAAAPEPVASPVAEPAPSPAPASRSAPAARAITVELITEPAGAAVVRARDGASLGSTPLTLTWPAAAGSEALSLEREGYRSEHVEVPRDHDLTARFHLEKVAPSPGEDTAPERHARAVPRAMVRPAPQSAPAGRRAPERGVSPAPSSAPSPSPSRVTPGRREPLKI